jgi:hypothetical protein
MHDIKSFSTRKLDWKESFLRHAKALVFSSFETTDKLYLLIDRSVNIMFKAFPNTSHSFRSILLVCFNDSALCPLPTELFSLSRFC